MLRAGIRPVPDARVTSSRGVCELETEISNWFDKCYSDSPAIRIRFTTIPWTAAF